MGKKVLFILGIILFIVVFLAYWILFREESDSPETTTELSQERIEEQKADTSTVRLIATGDTIAHDSINENARKSDGSYDFYQMMDNMQPYFDGADIRFCNQATPAGGEEFGISGYPVFNAPFAFTQDMVRLGCNLVNTGTNHTNDKGQALIDAMVGEWDKQDILAHAGANRSVEEKNAVKYFEVKGVKFAFLSYSTYSNTTISNGYGITMYSKPLAESQISEAEENANIIIVSMRWGTEYSPEINSSQNRISQELADAGADVVFGHGPHVLEPVKRLQGSDDNETLVWYSLGNFLNTQLDIESLTSVIAVMDIDTKSKQLKNVAALPIYQHYEWTAEEKKAQDLLARENIELYTLDNAAEPLARSQNDTTVEAQMQRIRGILNTFTEVSVIKSSEY